VIDPDIVAPERAQQAGVVGLRVLVSKTGTVEEVETWMGEGALRQAAVDGVKAWKYKPFVQDGEPREIQSTILLSFRDGVGKPSLIALGGVAGMAGGQAANKSWQSGAVSSGDAVTVSSGIVAGLLYRAVAPVYPPLARAARVQGVVVLHAILSKAGTIEDLQVISGPPMLVQAAEDAVRQWRYKPYLQDGVPVEVETTINVNFTFAPSIKPDAAGASGGESGGASPPADVPDPK
jgi:TonB family protein